MTYEEAVSYIENMQGFGSKPGLRRIRALTALIGEPQDGLRFVHITGTNGKGSTASMTARILMAAGYSVGLFVSPYVDDFRERIQINGEFIPESELAAGLERLIPVIRELRRRGFMQPSQFEVETALALDYYRRRGCDYVVLEAGVGGKSDCTNIVKTTEAAVITSISLDHTNVLGPTVRDIARDKSGIIKPGCETVITPRQPPEAVDEIKTACEAANSRLTIPEPKNAAILKRGLTGTELSYKGLALTIPMPGGHQVLNALTAVETALALRRRGANIPDGAICVGIAASRMPGRCECVRESPLCILDGGHNPAAVDALCALLDAALEGRRLTVIMGMFADKDYRSCIKKIASRAARFIGVSSGQPRSQEAEEIAAAARPYCAEVSFEPYIEKAAAAALRAAAPEDVILVCGSIYNISSARRVLASR